MANELLSLLLEIQQEVMSVTKNAQNPYFKSRYADYNNVQATIFPVLHGKGILVLQPTVALDGKNYIKTQLVHVESGESIESLTEIIHKAGDAQAQGSGISYARRYGIMSLLALSAEDDDGNQAAGTVPTQYALAQQAQQAQQVEKPLIEQGGAKWAGALEYCRENFCRAETLREWYTISDETCKALNARLDFLTDLHNAQ